MQCYCSVAVFSCCCCSVSPVTLQVAAFCCGRSCFAVSLQCCCTMLLDVLFCSVIAVSLHYVAGGPVSPVSLQCRCILVLVVLFCQCRCIMLPEVLFCSVTAVLMQDLQCHCSDAAFFLLLRLLYSAVLIQILQCHCSGAAFFVIATSFVFRSVDAKSIVSLQ